ncbi:MAG: response regulator [Dehalococcoidia bacterium]|nr:response regulator [Dehalococcoidia bacterium]
MFTVLIVDGSTEEQRMLSRLVEAQGWCALGASRGQEALDIVKRGLAQLVLVEVELEDMDGFEVCRRIRKLSTVPVIMVTRRRGEADMLRGFACGADDYVVKPYSPLELAARMRAVVKRSEGGHSKR